MATTQSNQSPHRLTRRQQDRLIEDAKAILTKRLSRKGALIKSPGDAATVGMFHLSQYEHEVFAILFLDSQNRLLQFRELFRGTINGASVYPREIVKECLAENAARVILMHNHPSGVAEPSFADQRITTRIEDALKLFDIEVLDHVIVAGTDFYSMKEFVKEARA